MRQAYWVLLIVLVCGYVMGIPTVKLASKDVNLSGGVITHKWKFDLQGHAGDESFRFQLYPGQVQSLVHTKCGLDGMDSTISVDKTSGWISFHFGQPLTEGQVVYADCALSFVELQQNFPKEVDQKEVRLSYYEDHYHCQTESPVLAQSVTIILPTEYVEHYTDQVKPVKKTGDRVELGSYRNVKTPSQETFKIHYVEKHAPVRINRWKRIVEVSHWGNVAIEDHIELENPGPKLKGEFSRLDLMLAAQMGRPTYAVGGVHVIVPSVNNGFYYRDVIGNISSSTVMEEGEVSKVQLRSRFPVMGGWKTQFYFGYNLPSDYALSYSAEDSTKFKLEVPYFTPIEEDVWIRNLEVHFIFPEGSKDIAVDTAHSFYDMRAEHTQTYLDTTGRPTIVMHFNQTFVNEMNHNLVVLYHFGSMSLIQEPVLLVSFVFLLFVIFLIVSRMSFSLGGGATLHGRDAELVTQLGEKYTRLHDARSNSMSVLLQMIKGKNFGQYDAKKKKVEQEVAGYERQAETIAQELASVHPQLADVAAAVELEERRKYNAVVEGVTLVKSKGTAPSTLDQTVTACDKAILSAIQGLLSVSKKKVE